MGSCCDLEVDVNGEEIFFVDKKILASFSCRFSTLFGRSVHTMSHLKVILHDFPGGSEGFELIVRFCYNNGKTEITPSNILLLHSAANFMEMKKDSSVLLNLIDQTEKYFEGFQCWTWSELLSSLKHCQDLFAGMNSSSTLHKFLDLFAERLALLNVASPYSSCSERTGSQLSCDTSSDSVKCYLLQNFWWFEDLVFLDVHLLEKVIRAMISHNFEHTTICSFLCYYQRSKLLGASQAEKRKIIGAVINLLFLLDRSSIYCRGLFNVFRMALCFKISKSCMNKLEPLMGSKLHQATINDLLVPSRRGKKYLYNVNLTLRLVKLFLAENQFLPCRVKKVALLMDLYLAEVAPDPHLKSSKFVALATALPDFARDSHDRIYLAIHMYLQVHGGLLCQEEKLKVCSVLNYGKLSRESLIDLAMNSELPAGTVANAHISQQYKLKSLIRGSKNVRSSSGSPFRHSTRQGSRSKNMDNWPDLMKSSHKITY